MFLSLEDAKKKLDSPKNLVRTMRDPEVRKDHKSFLSGNLTVRPLENGGRRNGDKNLPTFIKEVAGTLSRITTVKEVSEALEISPSTINKAKEDPKLKTKIEEDMEKVRDLAMDKLMASMNLIDNEKLTKSTARDLSQTAANMAKIIEKTMPKDGEENLGTKLILYAPTIKQENHFETKQVTD